MKRSMIAVCLLLLWPGPAIACYDDHKASAGWIDEQPGRWSGYGIVAQAGQSGRLMGLSLFAGGSGVMILLGLIGRAWLHPARTATDSSLDTDEGEPLVVRFEEPVCEPCCDWSDPC